MIATSDYRDFLAGLEAGSADLVLTDPPYNISRETGFAKGGVERFRVSMDFGEWDHKPIDVDALAELSFRALRKGGTAIIWYSVWNISYLAEALKKAGFVQLRLIEWLRTNPVPLNSKVNYLTNARDVAVSGVKGSKPAFHSEYDNGVYHYPIPRGRVHPTQKPLKLFRDLVRKHSNKDDLVVDPFLGSGTTAVAALELGRRFAGCDTDEHFVAVAEERILLTEQGLGV